MQSQYKRSVSIDAGRGIGFVGTIFEQPRQAIPRASGLHTEHVMKPLEFIWLDEATRASTAHRAARRRVCLLLRARL